MYIFLTFPLTVKAVVVLISHNITCLVNILISFLGHPMSFRFILAPSLRCAARRPLRDLSSLRTSLRPILDSSHFRGIHASPARHDSSFTNILADENPPAVQVKSITTEGIQLVDGLLIPSACIFLEGQVFLWDVPNKLWDGWGQEHLEIFETVLPKPGEKSNRQNSRDICSFVK